MPAIVRSAGQDPGGRLPAIASRCALAATAVLAGLLVLLRTTDWSTAFDGVLVIRDEAPPTFEPRR